MQFVDNRFNEIMGKIEYPENFNKDSPTLKMRKSSEIKVYIPRIMGTNKLILHLYNKDNTQLTNEYEGEWISLEKEYDVYLFQLKTRYLGSGLYFFTLKLDTVYGCIYALKEKNKMIFKRNEEFINRFQLTVYNYKYMKPKGAGGIIYHIFVDRFQRGGQTPIKEDGIYPDNWSVIPEYPEYPGAPFKNNTFYGGSLYGIASKLDYISSLGVDAIYLSPIFDSPSNHKYDTSDYMTVDKTLGGDEGLKYLIAESKKYGIDIILDGVFNHTGDDSIYFNKYGNFKSLGAFQSKESKYYPWYEFKEYPFKYTSWWNIDILPRINTGNISCMEYFVGERGVVDKYASFGIRGFRLDVADELSDSFIRDIKAKLNKHNLNSVLYGEVWEDGSNKIAYGTRKEYFRGDTLDGVMNYPLRVGIINYLNNSETSLLFYALCDIINHAPKRIRDLQMNLLGSHDTVRILTALANQNISGLSNSQLSEIRLNEQEKKIAKQKLMQAYTIVSTLPGVPVIYYGDEAGLEGYSDPFNRMPFPWGLEDKELLSFYRTIGNIRRKNSVYSNGEYKLIELNSNYLIFVRLSKSYCYYTLINNTDKPIYIGFTGKYFSFFKNQKYDSCVTYMLEGHSSDIIKLTREEYIII